MGGNRDYWETIQRFQDAAQAAVARVTPAIVRSYGPFPPSEHVGRLYLSQSPAPLSNPEGRLSLSIGVRFRVVDHGTVDIGWEVQTFAYSYLLFLDGREVIAYHWDSEGISADSVRTPHAHIGKELAHREMQSIDRERLEIISAAHLPTGLIPITALFRAIIRDFGVEPIRWQGERAEDARAAVDRSFAEAEAILLESFA